MKHKEKVKLARKMLSRVEREQGVSLFSSKAWTRRAEARRRKELLRMGIKLQ